VASPEFRIRASPELFTAGSESCLGPDGVRRRRRVRSSVFALLARASSLSVRRLSARGSALQLGYAGQDPPPRLARVRDARARVAFGGLTFRCCVVSFSRRRLIAARAQRQREGCAALALEGWTPPPHGQAPTPYLYKTTPKNM